MPKLMRPSRTRAASAVPSLESLPELLTIPEVMRVARIGRTAAYELARSGAVPAVRFGRTVRVPRAALVAAVGHSMTAQAR